MQYTVHCMQYTVYNMQYTVCNIQYTVCSIQYTICSIQYTVCSIQYTVCGIQYTVCGIQCTVYSLSHLHFDVPFPISWTPFFFYKSLRSGADLRLVTSVLHSTIELHLADSFCCCFNKLVMQHVWWITSHIHSFRVHPFIGSVWWRRWQVPLKCQHTSARLYDITSQKKTCLK